MSKNALNAIGLIVCLLVGILCFAAFLLMDDAVSLFLVSLLAFLGAIGYWQLCSAAWDRWRGEKPLTNRKFTKV